MSTKQLLPACVSGNGAAPAVDRILIAEDDPIFRRVLQHSLQQWNYRVTVAPDGVRAWQLLQQPDAPDLVILDWIMPGMDGLALCRRIRERRNARYQYILLLTSKDDKQDVVQGLEAGADDYLTKPFDTGELQARLHVGKRILKLQSDLLQAQEDLRFEASHDALTGIWNRRTILELLQRELQMSDRFNSSTGLLMIDLDHFKAINDTYGHLVGDAVLREAAHRTSQAVRSYDFVGRYGGEEFVVVLCNCSMHDLSTVAERVRSAVASASIVVGNTSIPVSASVGGTVATTTSTDVELLAAADSALYLAKQNGRNRVEILRSPLPAAAAHGSNLSDQ